MTERELLEMAAKAVGYTGSVYSFPGMEVRYGLTQAIYVEELDRHWNPLEDDADAFRLAVDLKMIISVTDFKVGASDGFYDGIVSTYGIGAHEAARYAITRAAAEIGAAKCA